MAIAIDITQPVPYIVPSDRKLPANEQTTFFIQVLSVGQAMLLATKFASLKDKIGTNGHALPLDEVRHMLNDFVVGWVNFRTANGKEVPFIPKAETNWDYLSMGTLGELLTGILEVNQLSEAQQKN